MSCDSHSFNVELAKMVGLTEAILLQHFHFWNQRARNLPEMHREGRVWFFRSVAEMREVFPYLSDGNVRTAIQHLIDRGLVIKGDFAEKSMYKATWYSLTDAAIRLFDLSVSANPFVESQNGFSETTKCIGNSNKDNRKDSSKKNNTIHFDFRSALIDLGVTEETADTWLAVRRSHKAVNSELAFKDLVAEIAKTGQSAEECIRIAAVHSWRGFKAEYLRPRNVVASQPQQPTYRMSPEERTMAALARLQSRDGMLHTFNADEQ